MIEISSPTKKFLKEINAGITSLVLLCVVSRSEEPMYGYQIAKQIDFGSEQGLSMKQSALYPVLRSLEKNELLESRVEPSITGPPRRYYEITRGGKEALEEWKDIWHHVKENVDAILEGGNND
ncbi:MAG: PadR family transcriptional regulator [Spirochaetales bacterium]|nr:PadR family transcriptional regulator [Spirochaetales bacterium]